MTMVKSMKDRLEALTRAAAEFERLYETVLVGPRVYRAYCQLKKETEAAQRWLGVNEALPPK